MLDDLSFFLGKKIAIVGYGYIGENLFRYLKPGSIKHEFNVEVFTRKNLAQIEGKTFDYLFNCAGLTGDFRDKILLTIESNIELTVFLLKKTQIIECYIGLSSTRIYGFSDEETTLFSEDILSAKSENHTGVNYIYDGSKKLMESILLNYSQINNFKIVICRLSNVFGNFHKRDLNDSTYLKLMIRYSLENKILILNQSSYGTKGYVHINDAISGILKAAVFSKDSQIFNICSGISYSVKEWLNFLKVQFKEPNKFIEARHSRISIEKSKKLLNYNPSYFLKSLNIDKIINNGSY